MQPLLSIENLSVNFVSERETTQAVKNISLRVNRGEIVALVGESGSGKSVTALSILQLNPTPLVNYVSGKIMFADPLPTDLLQLGYKELRPIRGQKIGTIFQEPMTSLNPVITCGKQVMEVLIAHKKITSVEAKKQTIAWFEKVKLPQPESLFYRYPHQLSGGQKQRVMIAMAMCCKPSLLICDEPTTALDVTVQNTILQLIKELQQEQNIGVIFITHDLGVVAQIANKISILYKGEIVEEGTVKEIFTSAKHSYTKALIACRPALHPKGTRLPTIHDYLTDAKTNKIITDEFINRKNRDASLMEIENVSVSFPAKTSLFGKPLQFVKAVSNVTFTLYKNETLGVVGESGCGKTTLGRTLLRLLEPSGGTILYKGSDITNLSNAAIKKLRKDVQLIFQDPYSSLNPRLTIGAAIAEPLQVAGLLETRAERKKKVMELLDKVALPAAAAERYPHQFSGGQRQRIVIARALGLNPDFLVCDESVSALDVSVQAQVLNLLNDLKKDLGLTLLFISHDLSVVRYMCDRMLVMKAGQIVESGEAEEVYLHPKTTYTRELLQAIPKIEVQA